MELSGASLERRNIRTKFCRFLLTGIHFLAHTLVYVTLIDRYKQISLLLMYSKNEIKDKFNPKMSWKRIKKCRILIQRLIWKVTEVSDMMFLLGKISFII